MKKLLTAILSIPGALAVAVSLGSHYIYNTVDRDVLNILGNSSSADIETSELGIAGYILRFVYNVEEYWVIILIVGIAWLIIAALAWELIKGDKKNGKNKRKVKKVKK